VDGHHTGKGTVIAAVLAGLLAIPAFLLAPILVVLAAVPLVVGLVALTRGERRVGLALTVVGALLTLPGAAALVLLKPYRIPSESMTATLGVGDRVLATRFGGADPQPGDVIVFHPPAAATGGKTGEEACGVAPPEGAACPQPSAGDSSESFVSRVIAVGGDRLTVVGGRAVVNGTTIAEPYVRPRCPSGETADFPTEITIPAGHVFVMSDNRQCSFDSRFYGPVRTGAVEGTVLFRFRPLSRVGRL